MRTCGSPEETASTTAIIEWLAGNRRAYTNKTDRIEIKAWWCNQKVAMTGKSYLGTLATAGCDNRCRRVEDRDR
ncbi:CocE/NonD family hydrolase [Latilactobacillus sakei]